MTIFAIEYVLWGTGLLCYGALALTMYRRELYQRSPVFAAWISEMFMSALVLIPISRCGSYQTYTLFYWLLTFLELCLQLGTAIEFSSQALRDRGLWLNGAKRYLTVGFTCAAILSCCLTILSNPAAAEGLDAFYVRVKLLTSLLTVFVTVITLTCSERHGSVWPRTELSSFFGFTVFACASAITDTLHIWWRTETTFLSLEVFRMVVSQAVLVFWLVLHTRASRRLSEPEQQNLRQLKDAYKLAQRSYTRDHVC